MAGPNYLGFAQLMGQRNPIAEGVEQFSGTLSDIQRQGIEREDRTRRNSLADLQMKQAQMGMDDSIARTNSLKALYQSPTLEGAYTAQAQAEMKQKEMERKQKGFETYLNTIKALDGMATLDPKTKTEIGKHFLSQNPEYAPMAANLTFVDSKGVKAARQFADGELTDPTTGKPLPGGYYETEGVWTGDINSPVKLVSYKLVKDKPEYKFREYNKGNKTVAEESQDGGRTWKQVSTADRYKPTATGGSGGGVSGTNGKPAKSLPASTLTDLADAKQLITTLNELDSNTVDTGPVVGRLQKLGAKFGLASEDFTSLESKISGINNIMLKLRSGAAVTDQEYQRFLNEMPTTNDQGQVFTTKQNNAFNFAKQLIEEKVANYEEGGYRVPDNMKRLPTNKRTQNADQPKQPAPPKPGQVVDGYRFKGGNPADQKNWMKVGR